MGCAWVSSSSPHVVLEVVDLDLGVDLDRVLHDLGGLVVDRRGGIESDDAASFFLVYFDMSHCTSSPRPIIEYFNNYLTLKT